MQDVITRIETLKPHSKEAIVLYFDMDKIHLDECENKFNELVDKFPENTIIALPDGLCIDSCSKDVLENIISKIQEVIDNKL